MPPGYSRHYYDLVQLAGSVHKSIAFADSRMLADVVKFKQRFYRSKWASYETAWPRTFQLVPNERLKTQLRGDYRAMRPMFFLEPPIWDVVIARLSVLEQEINDLPWST